MANIEISANLTGEASTKALAGARYVAQAQCYGRASAANPRAPQEPSGPPPLTSQGK